MTTDVDNYMFGSVLAMTGGGCGLVAWLSIAVLALFILFYHKLFAVTFDESFSRATGCGWTGTTPCWPSSRP